MSTLISIDGAIACPEDPGARISVLDRGFLYGDSVYEVMRTYQGRPFGEEEHFARLERSAELLGIILPVDRATLKREVLSVLQAAGNPESYIRLIITRGTGPIGLDPALAERPSRVVIVTELRPFPAELYRDGAAIRLVPAGRSAEGAVPQGAKSGNYLVNIMALGVARRQGAHEAVLLDATGRITEGASSNVFAVLGDLVCTPPLEAGILEGITRAKVIRLARQAGWRVEERELRPADLQRADEVFLTSTLREVLPVTRVDEWTVSSGRPGPVAARLRSLFQESARTAEIQE